MTKLDNGKEFFTFKEIAEKKKTTIQAVHQLAIRKKIKFKRVGNIKVVNAEDAKILIEAIRDQG